MNDGSMADKDRLAGTRDALLGLHKILVDAERANYEAVVGPIQSSTHFLHLLTTDAWFAWLHPISQLIVSMDEVLDEREPLTTELVVALMNQTRNLLVASETGEGFSRHYFEALQDDPDVVMAHAAIMKAMGPRQTAPPPAPSS